MIEAILVLGLLALDATYVNHRFDFTVHYPKGAFTLRPEAENGDGLEMVHRGGRGHVLVWASHMIENQDELLRASKLSDVKKGGKLTYERATPRWFVLSGHATPKRDFYHKAVASAGGAWQHLYFEYDAAAKATFVPLIEAMAPRFPN